MPAPPKPTTADLLAATTKTVPDLIAPDLKVLFCGINPGLWSAATGHHFARPGNRFWPALHRSGFTPRQLSPWEESELLSFGCGITNVVARTTASAAELEPGEFIAGRSILEKKAKRYRPAVVAVLGVGAYRHAFADRTAAIGPQERMLGPSRLWILPNPSGLNAHYQPNQLAELFAALRAAVS